MRNNLRSRQHNYGCRKCIDNYLFTITFHCVMLCGSTSWSRFLSMQECETKIAREIASLSKEDVSKEEMNENEEVINILLAQVVRIINPSSFCPSPPLIGLPEGSEWMQPMCGDKLRQLIAEKGLYLSVVWISWKHFHWEHFCDVSFLVRWPAAWIKVSCLFPKALMYLSDVFPSMPWKTSDVPLSYFKPVTGHFPPGLVATYPHSHSLSHILPASLASNCSVMFPDCESEHIKIIFFFFLVGEWDFDRTRRITGNGAVFAEANSFWKGGDRSSQSRNSRNSKVTQPLPDKAKALAEFWRNFLK